MTSQCQCCKGLFEKPVDEEAKSNTQLSEQIPAMKHGNTHGPNKQWNITEMQAPRVTMFGRTTSPWQQRSRSTEGEHY